MKVFLSCMQCQRERGIPSMEPFVADYYDDGITYITCSEGHETAYLMQTAKFEILLESGATALLEGFTMEACASFSASLERFYEYALNVMCLARGISEGFFNKMFKAMATQSERQLGAFMVLYAMEFGKVYDPVEIAKQRNRVIHQGKIPTPAEAHVFGSQVYSIISDIYPKLWEKHRVHMEALLTQDGRQKQAKVRPGVCVASSHGTMFFNGAWGGQEQDFGKVLERFREARIRIFDTAVPMLRLLHRIQKAGSTS
jgi:hypothetical protein